MGRKEARCGDILLFVLGAGPAVSVASEVGSLGDGCVVWISDKGVHGVAVSLNLALVEAASPIAAESPPWAFGSVSVGFDIDFPISMVVRGRESRIRSKVVRSVAKVRLAVLIGYIIQKLNSHDFHCLHRRPCLTSSGFTLFSTWHSTRPQSKLKGYT